MSFMSFMSFHMTLLDTFGRLWTPLDAFGLVPALRRLQSRRERELLELASSISSAASVVHVVASAIAITTMGTAAGSGGGGNDPGQK